MPVASTYGQNRGEQGAQCSTTGAGEMLENFREAGQSVKQRAQEGMESLRESAADYVEQGRAKAQDLGESLERQIRTQPLTSVLVAVGVGFLIGAIWSRT
jgi:ElaB/YqjD/DUF883 family membrane-anchored ribosome-binding protein